MRFVVGDDKDQRTLIIGPAAMLDPGKFAKLLIAAVGGHDQLGADGFAAG
jgi:hypothetical protein